MKLSVGDIVFVLDKKSKAVVPCQLVERISSVTLAGENVKNIAVSPGGKKFKLEEYDAPWFENYETAYDYLRETALKLVDDTMKRALGSAEKNFGYTHQAKPSVDLSALPEEKPAESNISQDDHDKSIDDSLLQSEQVFVDIGGQQVKVTLPKEFVNEQ